MAPKIHKRVSEDRGVVRDDGGTSWLDSLAWTSFIRLASS